jgi:predicted DNA-binding transcriptional regulator YafY
MLIQAMETRTVCRVTYRAGHDGRAKTFYLKPLKLFSHKDCLYLSLQVARHPGRVDRKPDFDPLLAVHRIAGIELTDRRYDYPAKYHFEDRFNRDFGVIKEDPFEVEVELRGWAAAYAAERIWSRSQKISKKPDGTTWLRFQASSEVELISWVLSFRGYCRVKKPRRLWAQLKKAAGTIDKIHQARPPGQGSR